MTMTKPVLSILLLLLYPIATSANSERGRLLYENHCRACHESNVHIRQTQAAKSLKAVRTEVVRWQGCSRCSGTGKTWATWRSI